MTFHNTASNFRLMLDQTDRIIIAPGVFDGLSARIALSLGYEALYMVGAGTSMSKLGWPDLGLATMNDMTENADMISNLNPSVPLISDCDTGFGGPIMVHRTVLRLIRSGVAAIHLEDQKQSKRCGHLLGKEIVDREEWYSRLRAALNARQESGSDIVVIARTDARQQLGFDEVIERLKGAIELGVDAVFPEALQSKEEARRACQALSPTPVLLNMVSNGATPEISADEAYEMGFKIVIYPSVGLRGAISGMKTSYETLKSSGTQKDASHSNPKAAFMLCGLEKCIEIDKQAGSSSFAEI